MAIRIMVEGKGMNLIFLDHMYQAYEAMISEDKEQYDYKWYDVDGINILRRGWREKFEALAQKQLTKLRQKDPRWQPFLVRRDHPFVYSGQAEIRPFQFAFRLEKRRTAFN